MDKNFCDDIKDTNETKCVPQDAESIKYPCQPVRPSDSDCCGSGCTTCVFDLYDLDMKRWQERCEEIDNGCAKAGELCASLSIYEYKTFRIVEEIELSENMKLFTFEIPDNARLPLVCGQHIVARCYSVDNKTIIRPYTPVSRLSERGRFVIAVKLYESGEMSRCIWKSWALGSSVDWRGPFGDFRYEANQYSSLILIAGGTGVTPMLQVIQTVLENEDDFTKVYLYYSVQSGTELIMKKEMDEWRSYWNFNVTYFITDKNVEDIDAYRKQHMKYGDVVFFDHITDESLVDFKQRNNASGAQGNCQVLICGTRSFNKDMNDVAMRCLGVRVEQIVVFN